MEVFCQTDVENGKMCLVEPQAHFILKNTGCHRWWLPQLWES